MLAANNLPKNINVLLSRTVELLNPKRIILFGSQARGEGKFYSDYDIAVVCDHNENNNWGQLHWELEEGELTLLPVDLVNWQDASHELRDRILREGKVLYERTS